MVNKQKILKVKEIQDLLKNNKNIVLLSFNKTTHQSLEGLRKELRKKGSSIRVIKNILFEKAVNKLSIENKKYFEFRKQFFPLKKSTAILLFKDDWSKGLKTFSEFVKKDGSMDFKFGLIDNLVYDYKDIKKIAQLPTKDELIAKILLCMKSPFIKLIYAGKYNTQKFVFILNSKGGGK